MHVSVQTSRPPSRRRATRSLDILVVAADAEVRSIIERAMAGADSDGRFSVTVLDSARVAVARAEQKVDVIIVDGRLRVPGGQVLLQCLGDACPSALRVAVVPKASSELGVRLAKIAHQVLEGPMNGDRWYALIHAAGEMRAVLAHPRVADAVGSALVLPSPPHTYTQLTHLLNGPGGSFHRVTEIVERDTGLSAKLLQMVSSSFFGLPKAVQSVGGAVAYLGVDTVKTLVLSVEVTSMFRPSPSLCGFDIQRQQHAALVTSRLARSLMPPSEQADFAQLAWSALFGRGLAPGRPRPPPFIEMPSSTASGNRLPCTTPSVSTSAWPAVKLGPACWGCGGFRERSVHRFATSIDRSRRLARPSSWLRPSMSRADWPTIRKHLWTQRPGP